MKHLYLKRKSDDKVVTSIEATDSNVSACIRGISTTLKHGFSVDWSNEYYIDDSEFEKAKYHNAEKFLYYIALGVSLLVLIILCFGCSCPEIVERIVTR